MKKANYLTSENIERKAAGWLEELPFCKRWPGDIHTGKSALLVIDMQKYFLDPESHAYLPATEAIIDNINYLVKLFVDKGGKVLYTTTVQDPEEKGSMLEWWSSIITEGPMTELDERIDVKGELIKKPTYSSFYRTELEEHLDDIENIFISGVMTDICCETSCREAFIRDYRTFFIADATATSGEEVHMSSLKSICHGLAEILLCKNVEQRLRS